ncbi:hypothetical protein TTHERM_00849300 (macronuclear) [Tetrahymena thermophila SB210]|uniref:Uncharacterized protein n=1 Tax=Tetrahymena thermophila (strain SB210) TaxID=312017 RepID=Q23R54_TETTS|nr:hypothetical protein TTHERM_00849300 [Tetrahymena thermophila SB210]EAR98987.1 hypothetical protein TTHERM_00849300 [Tetrahymena thermophila SB210]|eukprot:XP_001019232.1 hypothetical protein TTHERM_00849300 [Tetrahymena thermophila SB210]
MATQKSTVDIVKKTCVLPVIQARGAKRKGVTSMQALIIFKEFKRMLKGIIIIARFVPKSIFQHLQETQGCTQNETRDLKIKLAKVQAIKKKSLLPYTEL